MTINDSGVMLRKKQKAKAEDKKGNGGTQIRWMDTIEGRAVKRAVQLRIQQVNPFVLTNGKFGLQENGEYIARRMRKIPAFARLYTECRAIWPSISDLGRVVGQRGHKGYYKNDDGEGPNHNPFVYSPEHFTNCKALQDPEVIRLANLLVDLQEPYV